MRKRVSSTHSLRALPPAQGPGMEGGPRQRSAPRPFSLYGQRQVQFVFETACALGIGTRHCELVRAECCARIRASPAPPPQAAHSSISTSDASRDASVRRLGKTRRSPGTPPPVAAASSPSDGCGDGDIAATAAVALVNCLWARQVREQGEAYRTRDRRTCSVRFRAGSGFPRPAVPTSPHPPDL